MEDHVRRFFRIISEQFKTHVSFRVFLSVLSFADGLFGLVEISLTISYKMVIDIMLKFH